MSARIVLLVILLLILFHQPIPWRAQNPHFRAAENAESRLALGLPILLEGATQGDLELVPGIGATTAERIIATFDKHRHELAYGNVRCTELLLAVPRLGERTIKKLSPYLTCEQSVARGVNPPRR